MTASSTFVGSNAAYLVTDTAVFYPEPDVRIMALYPKVVASDALRVAACITGDCTYWETEEGLPMSQLGDVEDAFERCTSQDDLLAALPGVLTSAHDRFSDLSDGACKFRVLFAFWWKATQEPRAYVAGTPGFGVPDCKPFALNRIVNFVAPNVEGNVTGSGDPRAEALKIVKAQRQKPWEDGSFRVGGRAELTTVDSAGVRTETITSWPDRVGRKINPFGLTERLLGAFA